MILDIIPYSTQKNLGKAYNEAMALIPDGSHACIRDGDTAWLTPDYGVHLAEYIRLYPNSVLTCWTNRINERAEQQSGWAAIREIVKMPDLISIAEDYRRQLYGVTNITGFVSGFCLIIPKAVWLKYPFPEKQMYEDRGPHNLLGVDNYWTNEIRRNGIQVLRMDGLLLYHTYRMIDNSKNHLL